MNPLNDYVRSETRRQFFARGKNVLGYAALATLLGPKFKLFGATPKPAGGGAILPNFPPNVKQVIYLHMVGGPSQMDLYDYKPVMNKWYDKDLPDSIRKGQRLTTMTSGQKRFPIAPSMWPFKQAGQCGMWMNTELLPYTAKCVDDMAFIRSMHTDAINHEPAILQMQTGSMVPGRAVHRLLGQLRAGFDERKPANLLRARRRTDQQGTNPGHQRAVVVERFSFRRIRRRLLPQQGRSDPFHQQPARRARPFRREQLNGLRH